MNEPENWLRTPEWVNALEESSGDLETDGDSSKYLSFKNQNKMTNPISVTFINDDWKPVWLQFGDYEIPQQWSTFWMLDIKLQNVTDMAYDERILDRRWDLWEHLKRVDQQPMPITDEKCQHHNHEMMLHHY